MIDQIKSSATMDDAELRRTIAQEYKYLTNVFDQIKQFRQSETGQEKQIERHVKVTNRTGQIKTATELKDVQRAKTLEELHQRLDMYKASKAVKKGPRYEVNLKKKIKKKAKVAKAKEERKKLARALTKEKRSERKREEEEERRLFEAANSKNEKKPNVKDMKVESKDLSEEPKVGSIVFNKIDIVDETENDRPSKQRPKVALDKLEKTQRLISKLKEKGNVDKAAAIQKKVLWSNVMDKAEGVKVKDDKERIKKSIKRVEERKKKSEKKWKERIEHTQSKIEAKQKKRKDNLKSRKTDNIKKKIKKSIKKGRTIPGVNDK
uniref:Surfeit locus protein 6 homolog n=1 Tax=Cacopsylla melanoneura TaxID=428564 RepID=A0A8D8WJU8_9HEMI